MGYSPWDGKESDTAEWLTLSQFHIPAVELLLPLFSREFFFFQLEDNCFQLCTHIPLLPLKPPSHPTSHPSRASQLGSLCSRAASQQPSVLHMAAYVCQCCSLSLSHPLLPCCVHSSVLHVWVSLPALQIGSSVPLSRSHTYALIYDTCFSPSDLLYSYDRL